MDIVVCIDIGTVYTGYAYSSRVEFENNMLKIHLNEEWMSGHANLHTYKTPSTVLLQQDRTFHSYGYEAERKYIHLQEAKQQDLWYYFKRFKSDLKSKQFRKDTTIMEEGGKSMNAIALFTLVLKYLKSHFIDSLEESARYGSFEKGSAARYVITVPTKWDNASRECMKSAAKKAGINQCFIHTESEAAGRYCRLLPLRSTNEKPFYIPRPNSRYMLVNLGGSGIDAAVQNILENGDLQEFSKNVGNSSGGTRVDADFLKFLNSLFGNEFIDLYCKKHKHDFLELQFEFEIKKRQFSLDSDVGTKLELPSSLVKMYTSRHKQSIQFMIDDTDFVGRILSQDDYLILDKTVMKDIFGPAVKSTVGYLTNLTRDPETKQCDVIILVGGFADSSVVTGAAKFYLPNCDMLTVERAELAVLMGGVILGHNPDTFLRVKVPYSIGIGMAVPFNGSKHPSDKLFEAKDKQYCSAVFKPLFIGGKTVELGTYSSSFSLSVNRPLQKSVAIPTYVSSDKHSKYVTDNGCVFKGKIFVPIEGKDVVKARFVLFPNHIIVEGHAEKSKVLIQDMYTL